MKALIGMTDLGEAVREHQDGAILDLFVTSGANNCLFPAGFNRWRKRIEITVSSHARDNMANKDVIRTSAEFFNISIEEVLVINGKKSRKKTVLIKDISTNKVVKKIKESLDGL